MKTDTYYTRTCQECRHWVKCSDFRGLCHYNKDSAYRLETNAGEWCSSHSSIATGDPKQALPASGHHSPVSQPSPSQLRPRKGFSPVISTGDLGTYQFKVGDWVRHTARNHLVAQVTDNGRLRGRLQEMWYDVRFVKDEQFQEWTNNHPVSTLIPWTPKVGEKVWVDCESKRITVSRWDPKDKFPVCFIDDVDEEDGYKLGVCEPYVGQDKGNEG